MMPPLPGEPGATVPPGLTLGGYESGSRAPHPGAGGARCDDLGSGLYGGGAGVDTGASVPSVPASPLSDLPGLDGEEVGGAGPGVPGSGRVEPAEVATPGDQEPAPPTPDVPVASGDEDGGVAAPGGCPSTPATAAAATAAPPSTRCCTCRDIEDDANPECVLHGDPAVNGTADYSRPGDLRCAELGCPSYVRRHSGVWWHVGPWGAHGYPVGDFWGHRPRPEPGGYVERPSEVVLDENERHGR